MNEKKNKNAIIIVTYNRQPYCERTLEALLTPDAPGADIFILDNGSSDATPDYLRQVEAAHDNVTVVYNKENVGMAEGHKILLKTHVFDKGYSFIGKNDDDELLPADWPNILGYWDQIEEAGAVMVGFKRKCTDEYFNGLQWVSRKKENITPIHYGEYECYLSYIVPGFQLTTEKWWKFLYPCLTDYGHKFGGWDPAVAHPIRDIGKQCLVVYNRCSDHFQRWEDHPDYTQFKFKEIDAVREHIFDLRRQGKRDY